MLDYFTTWKEDLMNIRSPLRLSAIAMAIAAVSGAPASFAQTTPPPSQTESKPGGMGMGQGGMMGQGNQGGMMGQGGQGGMMGQGNQGSMMGQGGKMGDCMMGGRGGMSGDMMQMMSMMRNMMTMMSAQSGMMVAHVEGRIAELKTELKITDAQMPQWNRFAEALRGTAKSMNEMHQEMMQSRGTKTLPERLAVREKVLTAHLTSVKALQEALQPLYAALSDEQKKIADRIMIGPMGMM